MPAAAGSFVYIGTYTDGTSEGIYVSEFDSQSGTLGPPRLAGTVDKPSFVAVHPRRRLLYSVSEVSEFPTGDEATQRTTQKPGQKTTQEPSQKGTPKAMKSGGVIAWGINEDGTLRRINEQPSGGPGACFVEVAPGGRTVVVANYGGGSVASFAVERDGALSPRQSFHQHTGGSGVVERRQSAPHAHSIRVSPDGRFAFAPDLGQDKIVAYTFIGSMLVPAPNLDIDLPPGGGPRHFDWHPDGDRAFVNLEITSQLCELSYDPSTGRLTLQATASTLPEGFDEWNSTAECLVHPNGRFVFVSNRGHNSVATFELTDAGPKRIGLTPTGGDTPRGMGLSDDGRHLFAANQRSGNVLVFAVGEDGSLTPTGSEIAVDRPVNVRTFPRD